MMTELLAIEQLTVAFSGADGLQTVVSGADFSVAAGQKVALVGESGSGKSVTALSVLRLHDPLITHYGGTIRFAGRELLTLNESQMRQIRGRDIAMVFQEPMTALNPLHSIGRQIAEPLLLHEGLNATAARRRVVELLQRVGIADAENRLDAYPHMLSGGQRQRAMIAMALACRPKLLIADEPTTALDVTIQRQILDLLDELQHEFGMAVLLISHDLNLVRHFADRVCVMRNGTIVEQAATETLFAVQEHPYTRQLLASQPDPFPAAQERHALEGKPDMLAARGLSCRFPIKAGMFRRTVGTVDAVDNIDLSLKPGETLGIVGESGSGKSTLGMCLLRLQACEGEISFGQQRLDQIGSRAMRPLRRDMQVVFQDPYSSLSPRMTVEQIVGEGLAVHSPALGLQQRRERVVRVMEEVGLSGDMLGRYPHEFSGGQRQRIAIARAVVLEPKLILLDEPTSALDVSVQKQILALLRDLQKRHHMSYLFISHDLRVVRAIAHRVIVMHNGKVVEAGATERVFDQPQQPYTKRLLSAALFQ